MDIYYIYICMLPPLPMPKTNPNSKHIAIFGRFVSYGDVTLDRYDEGNMRVTYNIL